MSTMAESLSQAGLRVPMNRRIWNYLETHNEKSLDDIEKALRAQNSGVSVQLTDLEQRGMLVSIKLPVWRNGLKGIGSMRRYVKHFSIHPSLKNKPFELLPKPKALKPAVKEEPQSVHNVPAMDIKTTEKVVPRKNNTKYKGEAMETIALRLPVDMIKAVDDKIARLEEEIGVPVSRNQIIVGVLTKALKST